MEYSIILKIAKDLLKFDKINYGKARVLTVAHDNDRSYLFQGKYYSPLMDTIEDDLKAMYGVSCISIARIISVIKGKKSYAKVFSPEGKFARALIEKKISGIFRQQNFPYSKWEEQTWGLILDEVSPQKVLAILPSRELCKACHDRGIWVADVQHGVIAKNHPWYGANFRSGESKELLPDGFLVWDIGSANVINEWALEKGISVRVIGNRWLARFKQINKDDFLVQEARSRIGEYLNRSNTKPYILISLSWGEDNTVKGEVPKLLEEVIRSTADRYNWLIRLHPNQIIGFATHEFNIFIKQFDSRLSGFAEWEIATRSPLPVVLGFTDLHISWMSSVALEAAQMGIKSALLNPRLNGIFKDDYFSEYNKLGIIDFVSYDGKVIKDWITENLNTKAQSKMEQQKNDTNYRELLDFIAE